MIMYELNNMESIPENCNDCKCHWCSLPVKSNRSGNADEIKKVYMNKRHRNCPLREINVEEI